MLFTWAIFALAAMFACVAILSIVRAVLHVRRLRSEPPEPPMPNLDFAMADLHDMLANGQITPEEFEQLRLSVLTRAQVREALLRESQMRQPPTVGHAFEAIQRPPPLPTGPPAPPVAPPPPPPPAGEDVGGAGSRDAR